MSKRNKILLIILGISIIISVIGMILVLKYNREGWLLALIIFIYLISIPATICYCYDKFGKCIESSSSAEQACRRGYYLGFNWDLIFWLTLLIAPLGAILYIRNTHYMYLKKKNEENLNEMYN